MYTSGCPKIQNRCSHSNGSPPFAALKKFAPKSRSKVSRNSATVMTGRANTSRNCDDEGHPGEHRHLHQRHARCPHVEHGDDQVDGRHRRGDAGDEQADGVEVDAVARVRRRTPVFGA